MSEFENQVELAVYIITKQIIAREQTLAEIRCWPHGALAKRTDLDIDTMAGRIVADLLDAGWTAPKEQQ